MTIGYARVSSETQNLDRQIIELDNYINRKGIKEYEVISEKISGSVPAIDRKFNIVFNDKSCKHLIIEDFDRLGRNLIDILQTVERLLENGVNVTVLKYDQTAILDNGQRNPLWQILVSMMGTFAQMEREKIKERQKQGIAAAKKKGVYKGRKVGATKNNDKFLAENKAVIKQLKAGTSIRNTAKICGVSVGTVQKVKKMM